MAAPLPAAPMTADAFFDHPDVQFPMDRPDNVDFEDFVADRLKRYVDLVKNMTPGDNITTAIKAELKKDRSILSIPEGCNTPVPQRPTAPGLCSI